MQALQLSNNTMGTTIHTVKLAVFPSYFASSRFLSRSRSKTLGLISRHSHCQKSSFQLFTRALSALAVQTTESTNTEGLFLYYYLLFVVVFEPSFILFWSCFSCEAAMEGCDRFQVDKRQQGSCLYQYKEQEFKC